MPPERVDACSQFAGELTSFLAHGGSLTHQARGRRGFRTFFRRAIWGRGPRLTDLSRAGDEAQGAADQGQ